MSPAESRVAHSENDPNATISMESMGEVSPLLHQSSSSKLSEGAISSFRSTSSSEGGYLRFSSDWLVTANPNRNETPASERDRAIEQGIVKAAFLIRDAVLGEIENPSSGTYDPYLHPENSVLNLASLIFRQILSSRILRQAMLTTVWALALLTFVEPPKWCRGMEGDDSRECQVLMNLKGLPAGRTNETNVLEDYYYPSSKSVLLTRYQSQYLELIGSTFVCLVILFGIGRDGCSLVRYLRRGPALRTRSLQLFALAAIYTGLFSGYTLFQPFARLLLLGTFLPALHQEVAILLMVLPQVLNICFMLAVFVVFWAFLGTVLFYGTEQGQAGFSSLIDSMWTLWICITTANYPDCMMPSYNQNRLAGIYFVVFMIVSYFFFMNLILASVANTYDDVITESKNSQKVYEDAKLTEAFRLMDPSKSETVDRGTVMTLFKILNKDFPEFRHVSSRDAKLLYAVLDRDGNELISLNEFLDFGSVLLLEFFQEDEFATFVQKFFPNLYRSPGYQRFTKFIKSDTFELGVDAILVLNAVVVVIQSWPLLIGNAIAVNEGYLDGNIDTVWEMVEAVFTGVYCLEAVLKIIAMGWRSYSEKAKNAFDFVITVFAFLASAYVYYPNDYNDSRLIRYIVMARVFRLVRLIISMKPFRVIGVIWFEILPYATSVMLILFFIMYTFAALGVELYGGMVTRDPNNPLSYLLLDTDFSNNEYWANNFNDMISAFNVLFNLLVINNWTECEIGFEAVTQRRWVRYYFFTFHFCGVILVNNLVVAFFINSFLTQGKILEQRKDTLTVEGEAVIQGREALFEASMVTGTRTSLEGGFIARIRSNCAEEDEQDRLVRLFTQMSDRKSTQYRKAETN